MTTDAKVLFVDDEPNVLQGYQRQLRKQFPLDIAVGAQAGLQAMTQTGPYAVVVTDMRMPTMNGIEFLKHVRQQSPETVRLMLTGNADQQTATDAVNEGSVFRFLTKPCSAEVLSVAVTAALEQYALVTAERELLSKTLSGSINLLADVLSILNPTAFGQMAKIRRLCGDLCARLEMKNSWEVTIAATLSLIGCITVPEQVLNRLHQGQPLTKDEWSLYEAHPQVGARLITRIPRLEGAAEIVRRQNEPCQTTLAQGETDRTGLSANVLKAVIDFERFVSQGLTNAEAIAKLRAEPKVFRPTVVAMLGDCLAVKQHVTRDVSITDLCEGMILDEHLVTLKGDLLLARGSEISATLRERLASLANTSKGVKEPVRVLCPS